MKISLATIVGASLLVLGACADQNHDDSPAKPKIVEVFACSDYCPGPREKYIKRVYEGVRDEKHCLALGGKPYTYIGWGSTFICLAD
jgi:hypothetical protein